MSAQKENDGVGYKRPPKAYRWKKGQCGNPGRKRTRALKGAAEIIDRLFANPVTVVENGSARRANGLEVIVTQLVKKELAGDRRAMAVRLKYAEFAARQNVSRDILITSDQSDRRREMAKRAKAQEGEI
jgi:hypothetical protein